MQKDQQIKDLQHVCDGQPDEAQPAPKQQATAHVYVGPQQKHRAEQSREGCQDIQGGVHWSRSFLKRNARANSRTGDDAFECSMVEIRTRSRRYALSSST